jgi:trans-aconitate methyltransferase
VTAVAAPVTPEWLALREPADGAARATDLVEPIRRHLAVHGRAIVHDLGCGTGSMGRWLAPQLARRHHWVMHDRDADLLARAAADPPRGEDPTAVTIETRQDDVARLTPGELAGACLITASALLDLMTGEELEHLVTRCAEAGCPALLTLSVTGRVELAPADPLDERVASAFNAHQRRTTGGRRLLGPDAVDVAAEAFTRLGAEVQLRPSPWRLGPDEAALASEWVRQWVAAASEQRPELAAVTRAYLRRRLAQASAGRLRVRVHHTDLLAWPR